MNFVSDTDAHSTFNIYFPYMNSNDPAYCPTVDDLVAMFFDTSISDSMANIHHGGSNQIQLPFADNRRQTQTFHNYNVDYDASNLFQDAQRVNPNTYQSIEIEPILSPDFRFGGVEVEQMMTTSQTFPLIDFDFPPQSPILKIKKPVKPKRLNKKPKVLQATPLFVNMNEDWDVIDSITGRKRHPLLHEFLRQILDNKNYSDIVDYVDKPKGIFKFHRRHDAATLWQIAKARNTTSKMTYDTLARALRYYYKSQIICQAQGRYTFKFGEESGFGKTWIPL